MTSFLWILSVLAIGTAIGTANSSSSSSSSSISNSNNNAAIDFSSNLFEMPPLPPPPKFQNIPSPFNNIAPVIPNIMIGQNSNNQNTNNHNINNKNQLHQQCGGILTDIRGNIHTPNFPNKFPVPMKCVWIIDASVYMPAGGSGGSGSNSNSNSGDGSSGSSSSIGGGHGNDVTTSVANTSIVVYFTQQYVLTGLKFTEYIYYGDTYQVKSDQPTFEFNEDSVTQIAWVRFSSAYLLIEFTMDDLHGTHLRALNRLVDVYGFNITYEVDTMVKSFQCNAKKCRFLGHCYTTNDYSSYYCECFPGFTGEDCGTGPLCQDKNLNLCENGGICKYIGDTAVTCLCPKGFKGTKCEILELDEDNSGCSQKDTNCDSECQNYPTMTTITSITSSAATTMTKNNGGGSNIGGHAALPSLFEQDICKCSRHQTTTPLSNRELARYEIVFRLENSNLHSHQIDFVVTPSPTSSSSSSLSDSSSIITTTTSTTTTDPTTIILAKHINRILRNFNISAINDLEVHRTSAASADINFQFFGAKIDEYRVRDAVHKMVERGRIGNISLVPSWMEFRRETALKLQAVEAVNHKSDVREDEEFVLSCKAQGSTKMVFRWYKNNIYVNVTKATRKISSRILKDPGTKDHYIALLTVSKASRLDQGVYTCQVIDGSLQQCRSTIVQVLAKPELRVDPPSATVYRGESLRLRCTSPGSDRQAYGTLGYSWTKSNALFQSDPDIEMWEDLYPDGSILKINNIQKSANYTCISSNSAGKISKSVYVYVVGRGEVELCSNETRFGVRWPASSPGSPILADCPSRYEGQSRRICEQRDFGQPIWLMPDFSNCISDLMVDVNNEFRGLTFGYQKTNASAILKSCLEYAMNRHQNFLPGEAGFLLGLLQEIDEYLLEKGSPIEQEMAADTILQIMDIVLKSEHSLNTDGQVKQLQTLVQSASLNRETTIVQSIPPIPVPVPSTSLHYHQTSSFRLHRQYIRSLPFTWQIYGDHLFSDQFYIQMALTSPLQRIVTNGSIMLAVVSYKNLTHFLPRMYFQRNSYESSDINYMVASRIITSWLFYSNRSIDLSTPDFQHHHQQQQQNQHHQQQQQQQQQYHQQNYHQYQTNTALHLPLDIAQVEIIFQHQNSVATEWTPVCGYDTQATFESTWRTDFCITENLQENVTRCTCPGMGTFAILMAKTTFNTSIVRITARPMFVIISCGCCFFQSCIAFAMLLPVLYNRKCAVTFLKMQFCTATSTAMAIFTLGLLKLLPQNWHGIISSSLAGLLLLGSSTLVGIALIVQSELDTRKSPVSHLASGMRGAIGLSWFLPILYATAAPLVYTITGSKPSNWWLEIRSFGFILFVIIELLFVILFCLLFFTLFQKLLYLAKKHDKHNATILRRIALIYRTAIILAVKLTTDSCYLIYLNSNEFILNYVFGVSSIILGFSIVFCFVIKAEIRLKSESINKNKKSSNSSTSKHQHHGIEDYCSGSINSPLSFYTNHDVEKENDSAPPSSASPTSTKLPLTQLDCGGVGGIGIMTTTTGGSISGGGGGGSGGNSGGVVNCESSFHHEHFIEDHQIQHSQHHHQLHHHHHHHQQYHQQQLMLQQQQQQQQQHHQQQHQHQHQQQMHLQHHQSVNGNSSFRNDSDIVIGSNNSNSFGIPPQLPSTTVGCYEFETQPSTTTKYEIPTRNDFSDAYLIGTSNGIPTSTNNIPPQSIKLGEGFIKETNEFVGVSSLDILQGVGQDSIIGIRTNQIIDMEKCKSKSPQIDLSSHHHIATISLSSSSPQSIPSPLITTSSNTLKKLSSSPHHHHHHQLHQHHLQQQHQPLSSSMPPTITITATEDETILTTGPSLSLPSASQSQSSSSSTTVTTTKIIPESPDEPIDGMLDRITHDLDFLLNRTIELPSPQQPPPPPPTSSSSSSSSSSVSSSSSSSSAVGNRGSVISSTSLRQSITPAASATTTTTTTQAIITISSVSVGTITPPAPPPPSLTLHSIHEAIIEED